LAENSAFSLSCGLAANENARYGPFGSLKLVERANFPGYFGTKIIRLLQVEPKL
jgi:hypothetical protein